jgi:hypothetical protein
LSTTFSSQKIIENKSEESQLFAESNKKIMKEKGKINK